MIRPRKIIETMEGYSQPEKERESFVCLDLNENPYGCSPKVIEALRNITPKDVSAYPDYGPAISKIASCLDVPPEQVVLTNGADEAIKAVLEAYIEKGDEIILPTPTFDMFRIYGQISEAKVVDVLYNPDLSYPTGKVLDLISRQTRLIVIVNPNNPTGTAIEEGDIIKILEKAKDSIVLVDEAYNRFYSRSAKEFIKRYDNLIVIRTFSKAYGLAGLRVGYIISNRTVCGNIKKVIPPFSVNSLALKALMAAIDDNEFIDDSIRMISENRANLESELALLGIRVTKSEANFILADFGDSCNEVCEQLRQRRILVKNRSSYPLLAGCIRIGIGTKSQCDFLIKEIKKIVRERALLFDMDGVLVDVSQSYRMAVKKTAEYFTGQEVDLDFIQELKEQGGYNNDWDLTAVIVKKRGFTIEKETIVKKFQDFYLGGSDNPGLIANEKWLLSNDLLCQLYKKFILGIVTGRPRAEALYALNKLGISQFFDAIICMEDYPEDKAKPDPYPLLLAMQRLEARKGVYLGDSIDDMKAAVGAQIEAVGVIPSNTSSDKIRALLGENGAAIVIEDVNQIQEVL